MHCSYCGSAIPEDSLVCGYCGHAVKNTKEQAELDVAEIDDAAEAEQAVLPAEEGTEDPMVDIASIQPENEESKGSKADTAVTEEIQVDIPRGYTVEKPMYQEVPLTVPSVYEEQQEAMEYEVPVIKDRRMRPLKTASFFWTQVLLLIPVINIILLLIWAFRERSNVNRKAYARSILIWMVLLLVAALAGVVTMLLLQMPMDINYWIEQFRIMANNLPNL